MVGYGFGHGAGGAVQGFLILHPFFIFFQNFFQNGFNFLEILRVDWIVTSDGDSDAATTATKVRTIRETRILVNLL